MPKEVFRYSNQYVIRDGRIVYNPDVVGTKPTEEGEEVRRTEQFALHWDDEPHSIAQMSVQLDIEMVKDQIAMIEAGEWLGEDRLDGMIVFYSGPLKRSELQKLIRAGRRSRDAVHGADE